MQTFWFHWKDGWYFAKDVVGNIVIKKCVDAQPGSVVVSKAIIPIDEFNSIIDSFKDPEPSAADLAKAAEEEKKKKKR